VSTKNNPAIFGEVLFDCFPDGSAVLGGAPFNVAWHLHGLGMAPLMITAVGKDEHGEQVQQTMRQWGMDTRAVQTNPDFPTGRVRIEFVNGEPAYEIVPDQAYDHIDIGPVEPLLSVDSHNILYHGSLIARTQHTRDNLNTLISDCGLPTFVDINLRAPWWEEEQVHEVLAKAQWVKLNQDELSIITGRPVGDRQQIISAAKDLFADRSMQLLIVTLGGQGAVCVSEQGIVEGEPVPVNNLVDTVGAGDSFSAVMITGIMKQWPLQQTLARALEFASAVCEMRGATTTDKSLYQRFLSKWDSAGQSS
jgi:fructokinase